MSSRTRAAAILVLRALVIVLLMALAGGCGSSPAAQVVGSVAVTSDPSGLPVSVDGAATGRVTPTEVSATPGTHSVAVSSPLYAEQVKVVAVSAGQTTAVAFSPAERLGTLAVSSDPSGLDITLDGTPTGKHTPASIMTTPATHTVAVSGAGYATQSRQVTLAPGDTVVVAFAPSSNSVTVTGLVSDTRAGSPVAGATVSIGGVSATTDASGTYSLQLPPASGYTVLVLKMGFGTAKYIGLDVPGPAGTTCTAPTLVLRQDFDPARPHDPPSLVPKGVPSPLSGGSCAFTADVQGASGLGIRNLDWRLGTLDSLVRDGRDWDGGPNVVEQTVTLDTTLHADGPTVLYLTAYDYNYNSTTVAIPVTIANGGSGALGRPFAVQATAHTYSQAVGYYGLPALRTRGSELATTGEESPHTLVAAPRMASAGGTLYIDVQWKSVSGATGYEVYRGLSSSSSDAVRTGLTPEKVLDSAGTPTGLMHVIDGSSTLMAGVTYFYRVKACSGSTVSSFSSPAHATPLAPLTVTLVSPNAASTVPSLTPQFVWTVSPGVEADGVTFVYELAVSDEAAEGVVADVDVVDSESATYGDARGIAGGSYDPLEPGHHYSWDIVAAEAQRHENGLGEAPTAVSDAGGLDSSGSQNGAWDFFAPAP